MNKNIDRSKVAVVYHFFAHYRKPIIEELCKDADIDYYFLGENDTNQVFSSVKLHEFSKGDRFISLKNIWFGKYFLWQKGLIRALKHEKFDQVIFLGDWKYLSTWLAVFLFRSKIPCLFWGHGLLNRAPSIQNSIKFFFFKQFTAGGLLYDNRAKDILIEKGYKHPLTVIYNSLDYESQSKILVNLPKADMPLSLPYVIFSGRIIKERKLELLFEALVKLKNNQMNVGALIVGDGPHLENLKSYCKQLQLDTQVVFYGACYDEQKLAQFFVNSLGLVFPGPIGLAAIHSLTYGVPVITNDNIDSHKPEFEAIIDKETGLLFEDGNSESLASTIQNLISLTIEERNVMRIRALEVIREKYRPQVQSRLIKEALTIGNK